MTREVADFLKANKQLIEVGDFRKLYENALSGFNGSKRYAFISEITDLFEAAGIDPLYYMNDIPTGYHFESKLLKTYSIGNMDTIGSYAFAYTTGLDTLDISSVRYIGDHAFYMSSIKTIEIPGSVKEIQPSTFKHSDLVNAVINEGTTTILNDVFIHCYDLTDLWVPKSLTDIAASAFMSCTNLKNIYYNSTSYDFYNLNFNFNMIGSGKVDVHCTDKVITFYG